MAETAWVVTLAPPPVFTVCSWTGYVNFFGFNFLTCNMGMSSTSYHFWQIKCREKVKAEVFKLLRVKYALSITNENPLEIKKIEY